MPSRRRCWSRVAVIPSTSSTHTRAGERRHLHVPAGGDRPALQPSADEHRAREIPEGLGEGANRKSVEAGPEINLRMNRNALLDDLERRIAECRQEAGRGNLERQRRRRLAARERIELLFTIQERSKNSTSSSPIELPRLRRVMADQVVHWRCSVVSGHGLIEGRRQDCSRFAQDFTVGRRIAVGDNAAKIVKIMDLALKLGAPIVGLNDSGGARAFRRSVLSLAGCMLTFFCATRSPPESCRRFQPSWVRAPAAPCTRRPSPTSRSW